MTRFALLHMRQLALVAAFGSLLAACGGGQATPGPIELGMNEIDVEEANPADVACLEGLWSVDHASFAAYAESQLRQSTGSSASLEFDESTGDLLLGFSEEGLSDLNAEDFSLTVTLAGQGTYLLFVDAQGSAFYQVGAEAIALWRAGEQAAGTLIELPAGGGSADFIVTPVDVIEYTGMGARADGIPGTPENAVASAFTCRGDTLILGTQGEQAMRWERFE